MAQLVEATADTTQSPMADRGGILVVEDDEYIAHLLQFMLAQEGFTVHCAGDGDKACGLIDSIAPPRLALLDVILPGIDGVLLIGKIRGKPAWRHVPIIMLTAKSREADVVRALNAGADDYILKPFQPAELIARLRRHYC